MMNSRSEQTEHASHAFAPSSFELKPMKRVGPPLWIRCIAIWDGKDKLKPRREIEFKTGLNIISTTLRGRYESDRRSYNVGKTALCGLIRYCLGATHFGSEKLEGQIRRAFPNGAVSAEIIIDHKPWLIIRGFGSKRLTSVQQGSDLKALWRDYESNNRSGIEPYIQAIESALGLDTSRFSKIEPRALPFQTAIGLLTRDHVVGFRDVLYWSNSRTREAAFTRDKREKLFLALLGVGTGPLPIFKAEGPASASDAARAQLQYLTQALHAKLRLPKSIRGSLEQASKEIEERLTAADSKRKDAIERQQAAQIRLTIEELQQRLGEAQKRVLGVCTVCPITNEKINSLINRGCLLKDTGCEPASASAKVDEIKASLKKAETKLKKIKCVQNEVPQTASAPDERLRQARLELDRWTKTVDERSQTWNERRAEKASLEIHKKLYGRPEASQQQPEDASVQSTGATLGPQVTTVQHADLENAFQRVVAHFISDDAIGKLDGLEPQIKVATDGTLEGNTEKIAGDRGALLGVLAFDFAVLVLSMEKDICIPPLLVHDSPRLQDIHEMSYSKLFWLARALEEACGDPPLFQYIVATSTPPPPDLDYDQWCRLRLDGREPKGNGRLFRKIL